MHSDQLICLLVLNLKTSITKVTEVSFETPKDYMLQNLKMISSQILETPTQLQMTGFLSIFVHVQSLSPIILHFTKINPLKSNKERFFVSPKLLLWFLQYSDFRRKLGS